MNLSLHHPLDFVQAVQEDVSVGIRVRSDSIGRYGDCILELRCSFMALPVLME